jgi:hypothetical protein
VTDFFAFFGFKRAAAIDLGELKNRFHHLAASEHPDVAGASDFAQLNVGYQTLLDPKKRLAHLLELQGSNTASIAEPPPDLVTTFFEVAAALHTRDVAAINARCAQLTAIRDQMVKSLCDLRADELSSLRASHQHFAFLDRWLEQLNEAAFRAGE